MELVDFIEKFAEQFDDVDVEQLNSATRFRELDGYTSLVALLIITMIDEEYDVSLKGDDLLKSDTIQELFERIKK